MRPGWSPAAIYGDAEWADVDQSLAQLGLLQVDSHGFTAGGDFGPFTRVDSAGGTQYPTAAMTSNTAPSPYVASASAEYAAEYAAWKAFNRSNAGAYDAWLCNKTASDWLKIDLGSALTIATYKITTRNYSEVYYPTAWTLQGSNNDSDWTTIDTVAASGFTAANEEKEFTVDSPGAYRYYRLVITASNGMYTTIGELKLFTALGGNVEVTGGVLKVKGSLAWNVNGAYLTTQSAVNVPGAHRIKVTPLGATNQCMIGGQSGSFAISGQVGVGLLYAGTGGLVNYGAASGVQQQALWSLGQQYEVEQRWNNETKEVSLSYRTAGGTWQKLGFVRVHTLGTSPATLGFQINMHQSTAQWELDDYSRLSGYQTNGTPYRQQLADAGAILKWQNFDPSLLAKLYSGESANARYKWLFADNTEDWSASWLTWAELIAVAKQTGFKRYIGLRSQMNSDGATQCPVGPLDGSVTDGCSAGAAGGGCPIIGSPIVKGIAV